MTPLLILLLLFNVNTICLFQQLARLKRKGKKATFNLFEHSSNVDFLTVHTLFGSLVGILLLGVIVEFGLERLKQDGTSNKTGIMILVTKLNSNDY